MSATSLRSHTCGELRLGHAGQQVRLCGWVQTTRDFGKFIFIDLRDRYGITQLNIQADRQPELYALAKSLGREFVLAASGTVAERESKNPKLPTGDIELLPSSLELLNPSEVPPFLIEDETDGQEELRLQYRYLDLRRPKLRKALEVRAQVARTVRAHLDSLGFLEVETPNLIRSTPEGARDFIVPSRLQKGSFYALPQSPQLLKQLLMVAGYDRYYQIVKCYRDEDFRGDRQPEFTQIDCEMAFVGQDDILNTFEGMAKAVFREVKGVEIPDFPRISYAEALDKYGSDKPDLRFGLPLTSIKDLLPTGPDGPLAPALADPKQDVVALLAPGLAAYSRKQQDALVDFAKDSKNGGLKGLFFITLPAEGGLKSSLEKFYAPEVLQALAQHLEAQPGDAILLAAGPGAAVRKGLGRLRLEIAERQKLIPADSWSVFWVVDFPMFERDEETGALLPMHHPFVMPHPEDWALLDTAPEQARALCYDLVINGNEIVSGSVRIHRADIQEKIFGLLGLDEAERNEKFGFLLNAFKYGAPPHAGCAFGLDRWVMLLTGGDSIRDVIAFPKNSSGRDMMLDAPSPIAPDALKDLGIVVKEA